MMNRTTVMVIFSLVFITVCCSIDGSQAIAVTPATVVTSTIRDPQATTRPQAAVSPQRFQTPLPPFPYIEEEIVFEGGTEGVRLSGTLTIPKGEGPFAVAVLVSGAGGQDRDGTIMGHKPFMVIADHLTRHGIAVLRYDDRGIGASTGVRPGATTEDFALDALGAVDLLIRHDRIGKTSIGIIGHSEGGTIASLAAARSGDVAFIVMLGSPGLPGREYNIQYEESTARAMGQSDEAIMARSEFQAKVLDIVLGDGDKESENGAGKSKKAAIRKLFQAEHDGLPAERIDRAVKRFLSPWFVFNLKHDPSVTLSSVRCPVLTIYGSKDVQVPAAGNADAVRRALESAGNSDFRVLELEGLNHFFQTAGTGSPVEYGTIEETIAPKVLDILSDWIAGHGNGR
ncbi:MAG: alpha/beta hydrolase [Bacteroidales bacterium]|nr:alpha/beta hydrolase [Candidatus Latescibacterota bacterium]